MGDPVADPDADPAADPDADPAADPDADPAADPGDPLQRALELAYRYVNRRDRTEAEMRRRLEQAAVADAVIEQTIETLVDHGVIDDSRFARLFVEDKRTLERWGNDRITRTLIQRGIDRALIAEALADDATHDELDSALQLLRERFPNPPRDRRERDRAIGVMLRKGYDSELAVDALAAYARGGELD
jgi:regulatory protein